MKSILVYTVHKAGSTFLDLLISQTCRRFGVDRFSVNDDRYFDVINEQSWPTFIESTSGCACFGPIRASTNQPVFPENLDRYSIILHLRDPRDVLTSLYYSHAFSHTVRPNRFEASDDQREAWREQGVDKFVLKAAASWSQTYQQLCLKLLHLPNVKVVHYERMVLDFPNWLTQYLGAFEHIRVPKSKLPHHFLPQRSRRKKIWQQLAAKHRQSFVVDREDVNNHKRRVTPGDHAEKLQPQTIARLNEQFVDYFEMIAAASGRNVA